MKKIKTMEDVYRELGVTEADVIPFPNLPSTNEDDDYRVGVNAAAKLFLLNKALNEGWKHTPGNIGYYPVFYRTVGGSGFSFDVYDCVRSITIVGARLVFRTEELAEYAGKQFLDVYRDFMTFGQDN